MCRRKPNVVDLGVTGDVTGQVKVKMLDDLAYLVLPRTTAVSNGNKSIKQHGSCLEHYYPKHSVSIFKVKVIQGQDVKKRSRTHNLTLKHFLNHPNRTKFENWEKFQRAA